MEKDKTVRLCTVNLPEFIRTGIIDVKKVKHDWR